jgi:hypothetical protein
MSGLRRGALLLVGLGALLFTLTTFLAPARPDPVTGTVLAGGVPAEEARVRWKGTADPVLTGPDGSFLLPPRHSASTHVTAWSDGFFIAGVPADRKPLRLDLHPLPTEDHEDYAWVDPTPDPARPGNCGNCHGEIYREWSGSAHARSVSNVHFRNLYDGTDRHGNPGRGWNLLAEHPDGAGVCTACHAPTVPFGDPAYFDLRQAHGVDALGVHCDYCHKVTATGGKPGLTHGRFALTLLRPARGEGQLFFGPLDDVDRGEDAFSPIYRRSRYCAACHEGTVFGVPVYTTYSEWLESPAAREGKDCQACHTKPTGRLANLAPGKGGIDRDPQTLGSHALVVDSLDDVLRRCLRVTAHATREADAVRVEVELSAADVGHLVPTGFVDRHLVLTVEADTGSGQPAALRSGPTLPTQAGAGQAGRAGKLYGRLLKDFDGGVPAPFWRADPVVTDTRLAPGRPDRLTFVFAAAAGRVRVRLVYRRFLREVAESKGWPDNETVLSDRSLPVER